MLFDRGMKEACNDDEPLTFQTLAAVTARVLKLDEKQNVEAEGDGASAKPEEQKAVEHRRYVDQRLRDMSAFERRARGAK